MSVYGPDMLSEWSDMFTDSLVIDQQTGIDKWGNPVGIESIAPIACKVTSRSKSGGSEGAGERKEQDDLWRIQVVFMEVTPVPSVNEVVRVNGSKYVVESLDVFDDDRGICYTVSAVSIDEESRP